jgi:hypothetical protein
VQVAEKPAVALASLLRSRHHFMSAAPSVLHLPLLERGEGKVFSHHFTVKNAFSLLLHKQAFSTLGTFIEQHGNFFLAEPVHFEF